MSKLKPAKDRFYVWEPRSGYTRKRHKTFELAEAEAERLSETFPGNRYYVLFALGYAKKQKPVDQKEQQA